MGNTWQQLDVDIEDPLGLARVVAKLVVAAVLGAAMGWERERAGKAADMRTHMLVALGSAMFVLASVEAGVSAGDLTRVIQGVAAGIGFVGAGAILKMSEQGQVMGLTTAASIWMTAATGVAMGAGRPGLAVAGAILAVIVLRLFPWSRSAAPAEGETTSSP